jgi:hypothetical protein
MIIKIIGFFYSFVFVSMVYGQGCASYEKNLRDQLKNIFNKINNGEAIPDRNGKKINPKSVDDFLSLLPKKLTTDMIIMSSSQSAQSGTVESPRIILKSPNSEITLSFNTDVNLSGGDRVEALIFDAENAKYEIYEVDFSGTEPKKVNASDEAFFEQAGRKKKPAVHKDPSKCIACHGDPVRPIWQPYRFWTGQTPFLEDTLVKNSIETEWYMNYLENIKSKKPRWRHLTPPFTQEQAEKAINSTGKFEIPNQKAKAKEFSETDGSGNDLSNQFLDQNSCMVINNLKKRNDWNQIKYLVSGLLYECSPVSKFVPETLMNEAIAYNVRRGIGLDENGKFNFYNLSQDTKRRLDESTVYKADAHKAHLRQHISEDEVTKEFSIRQSIGYGFRNWENERSVDVISNLRFMLQPLGVDVNRWSMDNDPNSYAHGAVFSNYRQEPIIQEILEESNNDCDKLAKKSMEAIANHKLIEDPLALKNNECDYEKINNTEYIKSFMVIGKEALKLKVEETFVKQGCTYCHHKRSSSEAVYIDNIPELPLGDSNRFEELFKKRPALMNALQDRISTPPEAPGHMPPFGGSLTTQEIAEIKAYFEILRKSP